MLADQQQDRLVLRDVLDRLQRKHGVLGHCDRSGSEQRLPLEHDLGGAGV